MGSVNPQQQTHYFVPDASHWPLMGSAALFCLGLGAALAVNAIHVGYGVLGMGALILLTMLVGWFRDVVNEGLRGAYQGKEDIAFRWGMGWFIFSEIMFFAALFAALFYVRWVTLPTLGEFDYKMLYPDFVPNWPLSTAPDVTKPYQAVAVSGLPALNTLILLTSGVTVTWAHWGMLNRKRGQLIGGLFATVLLGIAFLACQFAEYHHAIHQLNLSFSSGAYGMTFFMLTGFHGMHVLLGTIMLIVIATRAWRGHFDGDRHFAFEAVAWYWHFVDVVWLLLFLFVYWL